MSAKLGQGSGVTVRFFSVLAWEFFRIVEQYFRKEKTLCCDPQRVWTEGLSAIVVKRLLNILLFNRVDQVLQRGARHSQ